MRIIDVVGFEGLYKVSEDGVIYTLSGRNGKHNYPLKQSIDKDGYKYVKLFKDGKYHNARVSRIVAEAFIPNPKGKPIVNHLDFNRSNNNVSNLEWTTNRENILHSSRVGRYNNINGKSVISIDNEGNKRSYPSMAEAARQTGISYPSIYRICKGLKYKVKGYQFFYEDCSGD